MKKKLLIVFLIFSQLSFASLTECIEAGKGFGSQREIPIEIPKKCKTLLMSDDTSIVYAKSRDNLVEVYGKKNLLFIRIFKIDKNKYVLDKEHFISGENSKLSKIIGIKINTKDGRVYVMNENHGQKSILSYFYNVGGNLSPARKLITDDLRDATGFEIDPVGERLYVYSFEKSWVKSFHKDSDPDGRRPANSSHVLQVFDADKSLLKSPIDIKIYNEKLFVLDSDRLLIFKNDLTPISTILSDGADFQNAVELSIDENKKSLTIRMKNKSEIFYDISML